MSGHRYSVDDMVTTTTGRMGKVVELLPPEKEGSPPRYRIKTDLGECFWSDDVLR
jgi:hypothetical protein